MTDRTLPPTGETTIVSARDGRSLAYIAYGETDWPLLIHNHGGPSSRLEGRVLANAANAHGLRLVSVDRPGIGRSSPHPERTYATWADDLTAIADALGYGRFGVSGWSEGGPWPLAAAFYIDPDRLRHVTSIAGGDYGTFGDNWAAKDLAALDAFGGKLAIHHPFTFRLMYEMLALDVVHFRTSYIRTLLKSVNDYDREVLNRPGVADAMADAGAECFAQGAAGLVADSEMLYRAWAFDVTTIERSVHIWQGTDDRLVPPPINREVAERTPGAVFHEVPGAGHFVAIGAGDEIFSIAAAELEGTR